MGGLEGVSGAAAQRKGRPMVAAMVVVGEETF